MRDARTELQAISPEVNSTQQEHSGGVLLWVAVVALYPVFFAWEVVVALWFGLMLRFRAIAHVLRCALARVRWLAVETRHLWTETRSEIGTATREARRRFVSSRRRAS